ncbi:DUF3592 domain-containing protein [Archangium gephyra]|nr:DUF3592 domain-containing protein [Archangium gephyra]
MNKSTALYVLVGCVVILGGVMAAAVYLNGREAENLRAEGVRVSATVLETSSSKTGWSSRTGDKIAYCVRLAFHTQGGDPASGYTCEVSKETWSSLHQGDAVDALYLPGTLRQDGGNRSADVVLWEQVTP